MEKTFTIGEVFSNGWELLKKYWLELLILFVIMIGVNIGVVVAETVAAFVPGIGGLLSVVVNLAGVVLTLMMSVGVIKIYFKMLDDKSYGYSEIFETNATAVFNYFLTALSYVLVLIVGLLLLIVPGIIWGYKYRYAIFISIENNVGPKEAFRISNEITTGAKMNLFILDIVTGLAVLVGVILLIIPGLIIAMAVYMGKLYLYRKLYYITYPPLAEELETEA